MRFTAIFLILFTGLLSGLFGQARDEVDSLKNLLSVEIQDSSRIKVFGQLCWIYAGTREKIDTARIYADSVYSLAARINEGRALAYAHFYYGFIERIEGNLAKSLDHFEKYISYHRSEGNQKLIATGLYQVGVVESNLGNYDEALAAYHETLKIHEENDYQYGIGFTLNSIGGIQRVFRNYDDAIGSYRRAIAIFEKSEQYWDLAMSLENLGNVYAEMDHFDSALHNYQRALEIDRRLDKKYGIASELENMANLYFEQDSISRALNFQLSSLEIRQELPQKRELAISLVKTGRLYGHMREFDKAQDYLEKGIDLALKIDAKPVIMDGYEQVALMNELRGDYFNANKYQKLYGLIKDSIFNENKIKQIAELETRYKSIEKDKQIQLLAGENEIKEAKVRQQSILKNALIGIILLILALTGTIYFALKQKIRAQRILAGKNEELKSSKYREELSALEMKALRSQMNPHFIFNCMNSINRMILSGENEEASRYLSKFSRLIRFTLENSEHTLITLEDELAMIDSYIQLESIRFKGRINYEISVEESIDPATTHLPSMVLQPFIENAIWHGLMHKSEPGNIKILIRQEEDELKCTIEDDGVGREMALKFAEKGHKGRSMGIKITEDRLRLISRQRLKDWIQVVDLKDSLNRALGTQVNIRIPLN